MNHYPVMLQKATEAMQHAYAPYSHFQVGACLRTENDVLFIGCNYENAAYSMTKCAEANAIGAMISTGQRKILEIVIIGSSNEPCAPCGACRQRLREFSDATTIVHMVGMQGKNITMSLFDLLPHSFGPEFLTKHPG